jgi:hypothetical protein
MRYAIHNILQSTISCLLLTLNEGSDYLLYLICYLMIFCIRLQGHKLITLRTRYLKLRYLLFLTVYYMPLLPFNMGSSCYISFIYLKLGLTQHVYAFLVHWVARHSSCRINSICWWCCYPNGIFIWIEWCYTIVYFAWWILIKHYTDISAWLIRHGWNVDW